MLAGKEPEENGVLHDVIEREPKEKEATKEQNHVLEKEQNTVGNGATVLVTTHSHKSTENKGKPKRQVTIFKGIGVSSNHWRTLNSGHFAQVWASKFLKCSIG